MFRSEVEKARLLLNCLFWEVVHKQLKAINIMFFKLIIYLTLLRQQKLQKIMIILLNNILVNNQVTSLFKDWFILNTVCAGWEGCVPRSSILTIQRVGSCKITPTSTRVRYCHVVLERWSHFGGIYYRSRISTRFWEMNIK